MKVVRLFREVVDAPYLVTSKVRLNSTLSNLIWLRASLFIAGELTQMTFKDTLQLNYSMINHIGNEFASLM